jgi:hypothetical protein
MRNYKLNGFWAGFSILLVVFVAYRLKDCGKPKSKPKAVEPTFVYVDSSSIRELIETNKRYDTLEGRFRIREAKYYSEINALKKRLSAIKPTYKYLPGLRDTIIFDCSEQIGIANQIIMNQDSLVVVYSQSLADCLNSREDLKAQTKFNIEFAAQMSKDKAELVKELGKYKHFVFRLYRKKKD